MDFDKILQEGSKIKTEAMAHQVQVRLIENLIEMARCSGEVELLKSELEKTLEIAIELTGAEKSSIFLFDNDGIVTDCILARGEVSTEKQSKLIGSVMDKGLAGWVCQHREVGLITDTDKDERWLTLPDQPYQVRSALAVPIIKGKELSGILTLLHSDIGYFGIETAKLMEKVANQIALAIENTKLYAKLDESYRSLRKAKKDIETYSKALDEELEKGRQIQRDFLPTEFPEIPGWEISACFYPAKQVAGDFYDVFDLPTGHLGLAIGDVCDKGVGAALFMALMRSLLRIFSRQYVDHDEPLAGKSEAITSVTEKAQLNAVRAIDQANKYISHEHDKMCMFATVFFGVLDPKTGMLAYVNAGHEPAVIVNKSHIKRHPL